MISLLDSATSAGEKSKEPDSGPPVGSYSFHSLPSQMKSQIDGPSTDGEPKCPGERPSRATKTHRLLAVILTKDICGIRRGIPQTLWGLPGSPRGNELKERKLWDGY